MHFQHKLKSGGVGPEMTVIPAGGFLMGSSDDEPERSGNEGPQHLVTFAKPFAIGRYAVTFEEYDRYCKAAGKKKPGDAGWGRGRLPVIKVSWQDAKDYCAWLSQETGKNYRLPSEAEWEYACRAGTATPFWWGDAITPAQANYDGRYGYNGGAEGQYRERTEPVGEFQPNPFGLYQMHGNVYEWCEDQWHDSYEKAPDNGKAWISNNDAGVGRVVRGGSWINLPPRLRSGNRDWYNPARRVLNLGFRALQD